MKDATQGWRKLTLSRTDEPIVPQIGEVVVLCFCPHKRSENWGLDIGSRYSEADGKEESVENGVLLWESALGCQSEFDGMNLGDFLQSYDIYFAPLPPLRSVIGRTDGCPEGS